MRPPPRRARLSLQNLEPREVPAGVVTVSVVDGVLTLSGDDLSNQVTYAAGTDAGGGPQVRLIPDATTIIDDLSDPKDPVPGAEVTIAGSPRALRASFKGGDDAFLLLDATSLRLADGADFDLGDGNNELNLTTTNGQILVGGLTVKAGDGFDSVWIRAPRDSGSGIATGRRQHHPVKISYGHGGYQGAMHYFDAPGLGGLQINAGAGDGAFNAIGQKVRGPVIGLLGNGEHSWSWGESNAGSFAVTGAGPGARLNVSLDSVQVTGGIRLTGAPHVDLLMNQVSVGGSVQVQKKWLPANFRIASPGARIAMIKSEVDGSVLVSSAGGASDSRALMQSVKVGGSVTVQATGASSSSSFSALDSAIGGAARILSSGPGDSMAQASVEGTTKARSVSLRSTETSFLSIDGSLEVVHPDDPAALGDVTVRGEGLSVINLGANRQSALSARSVAVSGAGLAMLQLAKASKLDLAGSLTVTSEKSAVVGDLDGDGLLDVAGAVTIVGMSEASLETGSSWTSGNVQVSSPLGAAHTRFDPLMLDLNGNLAILGGHNANVEVNPVAKSKMPGSIKVIGGPGDDHILVQSMTVGNGVTIDVKDGDNSVTMRKSFVIPHVLEKSGSIAISSGDGTDSVVLEEVEVRGNSNIRTGAGADLVGIDGSVLAGLVIDLGAGDDQLLLAQRLGSVAPVTFTGTLLAQAGAGNDRLALGLSTESPFFGDANSKIVFQAVGNRIDGGPGADLFDVESQQVETKPPATLSLSSWEIDP